MQTEIEEISLREIVQRLTSRWLLIFLITAACTGAAVTFALLAPWRYQSSVVLSPVTNDADAGRFGGAGALLSQMGGLAGLAGLGGAGSSKKVEAIATLQSSFLTEAFIREENLLPVLYSKQWNSTKSDWEIASPKDRPTLWKAEEYFRKAIRTVTEDKKSGLVTLTITWTDPRQAAEWATELVERTNAYLRQKTIEESRRNLAYLNDQLTKTSVVELQSAIYGLIESEIKKVMIANGNTEFAFRVIDPARVPERRVSPKRTIITLAGAFIGLALSIAIALLLPTRTSHVRR